MPAFNKFNVSYNSSRVQRAYRINNIETLKLQNRIQLLEKERLHRQRLTNQDIRLISLTLDYIQTCSGHSAEGLAPENERIPQPEEVREDNGPCFLYGERIVSRKKRRHNFRPQSAMDKSSSRMNSETTSIVSTTEITPRPQSSPAKRTTFVTHMARTDDADSVFGSSSESSKSESNTPTARFKPAWTKEPMPEVTKILLRSSAGTGKRGSIFERTQDNNLGEGSAALKTLTRSLRIKSHQPINDQRRESLHSIDEFTSGNLSPERGSRITDILNRGPKTAMSASAWKSHLNHAQSGPVSSSLQRQYVMDSKKAMNNERTEVITKRVKKFVSESSQL